MLQSGFLQALPVSKNNLALSYILNIMLKTNKLPNGWFLIIGITQDGEIKKKKIAESEETLKELLQMLTNMVCFNNLTFFTYKIEETTLL
jgi:hypothetical protein